MFPNRCLALRILTTIAVLMPFSVVGSSGPATGVSIFLTDNPVVRIRSVPAVSERTLEYLSAGDEASVPVWVLFTDKAVFTQAEYASKAATISLGEKVLRRRARTGRDRVLFVDLPVAPEYIEAVISSGGTLRRVSKWLNAASYDLPLDLLDEVGRLPFVAEIRPVATFRTDPGTIGQIRLDERNNKALWPDVLNYGPSLGQLTMINVPAVHDLGYTGLGITLAIFDTGFRKTHQAFAVHYLMGRVLAEWDFVFEDGDVANEAEDVPNQWNHGTYIWSTAGGFDDGMMYGPAYQASFLLAKTEDLRSETPAEEDNWVAAVEWADSLGADVITSSLSYSDWYTYEDLDGQTTLIAIAANTAAALGIVVCNSMGNSGPAPGTLTSPADAFEILACGAVNSNEVLASFSSRGPTFDGRTKPEVCAQGVSTFCASASGDDTYTTVGGTSLSTPLVAGAACVLLEARPTFSPQAIRLALMETADNADSPNNDYGWGVIDLLAALDWGCNFYSDVTFAHAPVTVQFFDSSQFDVTSWYWSFGDSDSSTVQNPTHLYDVPGFYDVSLSIETAASGGFSKSKSAYMIVLADTVWFGTDSAYAGEEVLISITATNSQELDKLLIPFTFEENPALTFDSVRLGSRTSYFQGLTTKLYNPSGRMFAYELTADLGGGAPALAPGSGEILRLYFSIDEWANGGATNPVDSLVFGNFLLQMISPQLAYQPVVHAGAVQTRYTLRGDFNHSGGWDISDLTGLVDYLFRSGPGPFTKHSGDADADRIITVADITYMVDYLFRNGPPPPTP